MSDEECLAKEQAANDCIKEIAEKYGDLLGFIWGQGDGQGSAVIISLISEMLERGFIELNEVPRYYKSIIEYRS
jgi:hypothetical protein